MNLFRRWCSALRERLSLFLGLEKPEPEATHLPEGYRFSYDFCFFLHDQVLETLKPGGKADIFSVRLDIQEGDPVAPQNLVGEEFVSWLEDNGYQDAVRLMTYKLICAALIADRELEPTDFI